ncbi:MAG: hypothetical protein AAGA12_04890 [Pseudomonadota bacterium]
MTFRSAFSGSLIAVALAVSTPVVAQDNLESIKADLAIELPRYGYKNVDLDSLSTVKIMHIRHLIYSNKSQSQIRGHIGAVLGRSLIGTIFR